MNRFLWWTILSLTIAGAAPAAEMPAFSHKRHAALKLPCVYCHQSAAKSARAGFPTRETCRTCHTSYSGPEKFPTHRIYKEPDFVFFSHAVHVNAKTECATCHGPVYQRDVLTAEVRHKMVDCVACHKAAKATVQCTACHELGQ